MGFDCFNDTKLCKCTLLALFNVVRAQSQLSRNFVIFLRLWLSGRIGHSPRDSTATQFRVAHSLRHVKPTNSVKSTILTRVSMQSRT